LPFRPVLHDGRLLVQFGTPSGGHEDGASTPVQEVQVPPCALQLPVRMQLENPDVKLEMLHASPRVPTRTTSPLGWLTVTPQCAVPCVAIPPGHEESEKAPPPELFTVNVKSVAVHGGGKSRACIGVRQLLSTTGSSVVALLVFEQSVAVASLPIAVLNVVSAFARHAVGSTPVAACFDRQFSLLAAFLAIATSFFESQTLLVGEPSLSPTAVIALLSQVSIRP